MFLLGGERGATWGEQEGSQIEKVKKNKKDANRWERNVREASNKGKKTKGKSK